MKGIWGSSENGSQEKCPTCGSPCGPKVECQSCGKVGCTDCIGMEKPYDCKQCGKGPIIYIN